jgi:hypothetical protein
MHEGDWAIHRGAAVFLDGAIDVHVVGSHFDQIDGNGIIARKTKFNTISMGNNVGMNYPWFFCNFDR